MGQFESAAYTNLGPKNFPANLAAPLDSDATMCYSYAMKTTTQVNADLLNRIADVLDADETLWDQSHWSSEDDDRDDPALLGYVDPLSAGYDDGEDTDAVGDCGTRACIAGWAVHLTPVARRPVDHDGISDAARQLLGLDYADADALFDSAWLPPAGVSVADELRRIAVGGKVRFDRFDENGDPVDANGDPVGASTL